MKSTKVPKNAQKYPNEPKSAQKIPQSTQQQYYPIVPNKNYQQVPKRTQK